MNDCTHTHTHSVRAANLAQEGGLSHRWRHPAPPSDGQRLAGSLRRIAMVGTALVLGVAAVYALRQTASWWIFAAQPQE